jgi:2-keto-4-pentenoate hydratase/2-oxohepta-3-ene-1,7-dioic acid hydratase in catechol pathway
MEEIICGIDAFVPTKVICVGQNFADHAKEMGGGAPPTEPVIFLKPNSSISFTPDSVYIPEDLGLLHHEVEFCALVGQGGKGLDDKAARAGIIGYAVGIDFTLREMQSEAKSGGHPWTISKGFDSSCVMGHFVPSSQVGDIEGRGISLSVNGEGRQTGSASDMIFKPERILSFVSRFMTVERGDIIMCGTPAGVGEVNDGDRIAASVEGLPKLDFVVNRR